MKIKEKGLTGKAAQRKRDNLLGNNPRRGFNAFAEMRQNNKQNGKDGGGKKEAQKKEVFLEFMGKKLKVNEEDGGKVDEADIPMVKRSALKIKGLNGTMTFDEVKVGVENLRYFPILLTDELCLRISHQGPLKDYFGISPFIKFEKDADPTSALVGFSRALTDEDVTYVKTQVKKVDDREITWEDAEGKYRKPHGCFFTFL